MRFPAKKPRVSFGLPYLFIELFYIGMPVVPTDGRSIGRTYGHVITKLFRMGRVPHFPRYGAMLVQANRALGAPLKSPEYVV